MNRDKNPFSAPGRAAEGGRAADGDSTAERTPATDRSDAAGPRQDGRDSRDGTLAADDPLRRALEDLPRYSAGSQFTTELMRRLEEEPPPPRLLSKKSVRGPLVDYRLAWAASLALVAVLAFGVAQWKPDPAGPEVVEVVEPRSEALDELRRQHLLLTRELTDLKALLETSEPVMVLGGRENLGFILPRQGDDESYAGGAAALPESQRLRPVRVLPTAYSRL